MPRLWQSLPIGNSNCVARDHDGRIQIVVGQRYNSLLGIAWCFRPVMYWQYHGSRCPVQNA